MHDRPTALVFRERLLPISETFISSQANSLRHYDATFVGFYSEVPSLPILHRKITLANSYSRKIDRLRVRFFNTTGFAPRFWQELDDVSPSVVHAHFAPDGVSAIRLSRAFRVPLVVTLHGYDVTRNCDFASRYKPLWVHADRFLCVSSFIRDRAAEVGFPLHKLFCHYTGVDTEHFRRRLGLEDYDRNKVFFVGRLVEKKGCDDFLKALVLLHKRLPDCYGVVIGDGPLRDSLTKMASKEGIPCQFLGSQDSATIRAHLESAAALCFPSKTALDGDSEGLGMVLLEAASLGVPVVATRHGGIPEAVIDGVTGLLVPERSPEALAESLERLLCDPIFRLTAAKAATAHIAQHFDLRRQTRALEETYHEIRANHIGSQMTSSR